MLRIPTVLQIGAALDTGGVERGIVEMSAYIIQQGWHSKAASAGGRLVADIKSQGAEHFTLPLHKRTPFHILFNGLKLARLIKKHNVSLVHARSRAPAWAAKIACWLTGTPMITTFHGTYGLKEPGKKIYNRIMVQGKHTIAISNFIKNHIMENYSVANAQISVAHRGFDKERFNPAIITPEQRAKLRAKLGVEDDRPIIIMPGRLTRWKGQSVFIDALTRIKQLKWHAIIVGGMGKSNSNFLSELQQQVIKNNLGDKVFFYGHQDNMPLVYAACDMAVHASIEPEAFGRVIVEAQAMKLPVIATNNGAATEIIKPNETGWLVPPNDPHALAQTIQEAIATPENLLIMGDNARRHVLRHFTTEHMCEREFAVYKRFVAD